LQHQDFGFESQRLLTFELPLDDAKYPNRRRRSRSSNQVIERVRQVPGVVTLGIVDTLPLGHGMGWGKFVSGEGFPPMHSWPTCLMRNLI